MFITIFRKENDNQETDNCMECDYELCRGAQPEHALSTLPTQTE